jgi:hypothetical protein
VSCLTFTIIYNCGEFSYLIDVPLFLNNWFVMFLYVGLSQYILIIMLYSYKEYNGNIYISLMWLMKVNTQTRKCKKVVNKSETVMFSKTKTKRNKKTKTKCNV